MNKTTCCSLLSCLALLLAACSYDQNRIIECDSGFKTPLSVSAALYEGSVMWTENAGGVARVRKMLPGEVCTKRIIHN